LDVPSTSLDTMCSRYLHVEPEAWLHGTAFGDALQDVSNSSSRPNGYRLAAVELRVIPVQFGQLQRLASELLQRSICLSHGKVERPRHIHSWVGLEELSAAPQVQEAC